ncbi:MAG: nucleoside deaminase [Actinomycetota bacterium]
MTHDDDLRFLRRTIELADEAVANGNHPFGSVLVDASGAVLGEGGNEYTIDAGPGHAETNLARRAARGYPIETLRGATLYTSVEPCCMCAGTIYWAEIGTVVYGMSEKRLAELTEGDEQNPTQDLDCRTVFAAGRNRTEVRGPYRELEESIAAQHVAFWNHR